MTPPDGRNDGDDDREREAALREDHRSGGADAVRRYCDICGSTALDDMRCKIICRNCGTILSTCSDL